MESIIINWNKVITKVEKCGAQLVLLHQCISTISRLDEAHGFGDEDEKGKIAL